MDKRGLKRKLMKARLAQIRWSRLKKDTCCPRCERQALVVRRNRVAEIHDCGSCGYIQAWDREQLGR